jgi:zinc D-Ala-D-Ala carboxypeptidase
VRWGKEKASIGFSRLAGKRHLDRWLVVAMILACAFVTGYAFVEARQASTQPVTTQSVITQSATKPVTPSLPPVLDAAGAGGSAGRPATVSVNREAQTTSLPAPGESCDDLKVLVDRSHALPPDYTPDDLVTLSEYKVPTLGSAEMLLRREAAGHLRRLVKAAAADGEELVVASAYRSYADQRVAYRRLRSIYGSEADLMSARPGHSQHQLGTAVDFTNAAAGYEVWDYFGDTSAYRWLRDHAREHGFVLAYPRSKEAETGYQWEPWHYRYVGAKNVERLEESDLSLQEFLAREGVLARC